MLSSLWWIRTNARLGGLALLDPMVDYVKSILSKARMDLKNGDKEVREEVITVICYDTELVEAVGTERGKVS